MKAIMVRSMADPGYWAMMLSDKVGATEFLVSQIEAGFVLAGMPRMAGRLASLAGYSAKIYLSKKVNDKISGEVWQSVGSNKGKGASKKVVVSELSKKQLDALKSVPKGILDDTGTKVDLDKFIAKPGKTSKRRFLKSFKGNKPDFDNSIVLEADGLWPNSHGGSCWKLKINNKRIATLGSQGEVLRP